MGSGRGIVKNIFSLVIAEIITRLINLIAIAYIGRLLGAGGFGKIGFVQSMLIYFVGAAILGLHIYGIREVAKKRNNVQSRVRSIVRLKLATTGISLFFYFTLILFLNQPVEIKHIMLIMSVSIIANGLILDWVFSGLEKMELVALERLIRSVFYLSLLFVLVRSSGDLLWVPSALVAGELLGVLFFYLIYRHYFGALRLFPAEDAEWDVLRASLPIALSNFSVQIYYYLNIVLLGFWSTYTITGLYSSAFKIVITILGAGILISKALYPAIARLFKDAPERAQELLSLVQRLLISLGLPVAVTGTLLADEIITFIYGTEFKGAAAALQILIWSCFTTFSGIAYSTSLLAADMQKQNLVATGAGAGMNIILCVWLIPAHQLVGAALATMVADLTVFFLIYYFGRRVVHSGYLSFLPKPVIASSVMGATAWVLHLPLLMTLLISFSVYILVLSFLGGIKIEDVRMIRSAIFSNASERG